MHAFCWARELQKKVTQKFSLFAYLLMIFLRQSAAFLRVLHLEACQMFFNVTWEQDQAWIRWSKQARWHKTVERQWKETGSHCHSLIFLSALTAKKKDKRMPTWRVASAFHSLNPCDATPCAGVHTLHTLVPTQRHWNYIAKPRHVQH